MYFQSFSTFKTNRSKWYYSFDSQTSQKSPFLSSNLNPKSLVANHSKGDGRAHHHWPEEARRRWGKWRRSTSRPARTCRWPQLGRRWSMDCWPRKHGGTGLWPRRRLQIAALKLGEVARRAKHKVATPMAVSVERGEGRRDRSGGAGNELSVRPWRAALWCTRAVITGVGKARASA
jgi:hypothetical protein